MPTHLTQPSFPRLTPLRSRSARFVLLPALLLAGSLHAAETPTRALEAARLNNLGTAYMNQQLLEKAAAKFSQAYEADPSLGLAKVNEGIAWLYLQKFPEAQKALDVATVKAPRDPHTWYALGLLDRNQNQPKQALESFNKALAIDPADPDTHYLAASVDLELADLPAAIVEFRKALELSPLHASSEFGLARALQRQGKTDEAHIAFVQFQHITTSHLGAPLSHTYGDEGRYGHVEDASLAVTSVAPMIPVTFAESWHSSALPGKTAGAACLIDLTAKDGANALTVALLGSGEHAIQLFRPTAKALVPLANTGLDASGTGIACAVGDYDNDGLPDIALALTRPDGAPAILLYRNLGDGRFEDVTKATSIVSANKPTSLTFVDYDHDGDLDLFVTGSPLSALWRNNGNKTFTDWTKESGLGGSTPTTNAILSDLNNDRAVDLLVTGSSPAPTFFANRREGPFAASPLFADGLPPTTSVTTLDYNKDGWMDVVLTHAGAPGVTLWRNLDGQHFERVPLPLTDAIGATSATPVDIDNDGWIDVALLIQTANGPALRVLRNQGPAGFVDVTAALHLDQLKLQSPNALVAADFTHHGAADLLIAQTDGSSVLLASQGNTNHSLAIALKGMADNKTGVGTKVEVFANGLWQKWEVTTQQEILAGLGGSEQADLVRLLWPTGVPQDEISDGTQNAKLEQPKVHIITELDRRGSSCPTLFAWNGSKYSFVSDVIGAAVVGHWVSPTEHNIPDPDEWIKVDGAQLQQHNGRYSLRFGEPMEEVNFVDQVRLVAVDHPTGTAVYPNEGFLSEPPFAQEKTILTRQPRALAGALDANGKDVLSILSAPQAAHDPIYVRDFTNLPFAGFANSHTLTLDLGEVSQDQPLRLLLHGFIEYFSASSMYSAWQAGLAPVPPYVEAQLPDGSWRKIVDDMGFPAGLPRTVVVDLTGKLPAGSHRIRLTTNLQIYWDQALLDTDSEGGNAGVRSAKNFRQTELPLTQAALAFRGYPEQQDGKTPGDLSYNYQRISATGPFVPHRGAYTRYGDVTPLLHAVDDEFVIFGTGEDMDLEFAANALPALPKGWTRDFFFYANGFVKDMDFYEASPFNVGQLPFHGMSGYPYPATEHYPDDPAHVAYQLEYNTRFESGSTARAFQFHYQAKSSRPDAAR